jgi:hypothetical protein
VEDAAHEDVDEVPDCRHEDWSVFAPRNASERSKSRRGSGALSCAAPHDRQNLLPGVTGVPQLGQVASSRAPHSSQKRASTVFSL